MKEQLLNCPFCGSPGTYHGHGYSDDYCSVGCSNEDCSVNPFATAHPELHPWDDTKQTFWIDWDKAEKEAAQKWNTRTIFGG